MKRESFLLFMEALIGEQVTGERRMEMRGQTELWRLSR